MLQDLDLNKLISGKNKKEQVAQMQNLIKEIDFVVRKNEVPVAMAIAAFTGLQKRYDNYAINTTILKVEEDGKNKSIISA